VATTPSPPSTTRRDTSTLISPSDVSFVVFGTKWTLPPTIDQFASIRHCDSAYSGSEAGGAIGSMNVTYTGGILYTDPGSTNGLSTGLDPTGVRPATGK